MFGHDADGKGSVARLAEVFGAPEPAIRLLLSILLGYPIATIYRLIVVHQQSKTLHHIYFATSGLLLCIFNYGFDAYHSMIAIWITYLHSRLLQNSPKQLLIINFIFHMSYLLIGYYYTESNDYDIIWTMPHCVLVLRLIGLGFDIADGKKTPNDTLSSDQKERALDKMPTLLEVMAYAYFPLAFLVGPQFPFSRYMRFINGEFRQYKDSLRAGLIRFAIGLIYLAVRQIGSIMLPDSYLLTDAFRNQTLCWRLIHLGLWGKISLYKYISCWLLTEGSLICIGFSYAGRTADGQNDWSGCSNVKLMLLETGNKMAHYVQSFNVNTNNWVANYVYKRLKFLNNRTISYAAALTFLAVWHGFHSGYYMAFLIEYMIISTEKQVESVYNSAILPRYGAYLNSSATYKCLTFIALKAYNTIYMGWCLIPFIFLNYDRWIRVFAAVDYFGFIIVGIWFVIYQFYKFFEVSAKKKAA